ncbi:tape measure domain-containing protein [Pseudomonas lundensis]|uniref:tape measure protein n=1 Tax=Pseudomonas lundensis TaxID=86185 RepID=UPI0006992623|nr:tape measure domain-containing protein [Pseudomonas lundensis]QVQ77775.1 tape measure domain-containing protein [Pseudomonas lundensis]QVQ83155.1 tape measure domain-containing protein [Pseudomonas lundensis]
MTQQSSRLDIIIDSRQAQRNGEQLRITLNNLNVVGDQTIRSMNGAGNAARAAGSAFAALGAGQVAREIVRLTDAFKSMQGSLALVSASTGAASQAFSELLGMANNTGSSLESTVALYTRLANATKGVGYSQEQLLNVTDAINKAFVVSGATAQEASNAAIQLSQGLAAGALRGEELNSVMEQGPRITRALADYLGVTNGQIRAMAAEGKITAEVVTNALLRSLSSLNEELDRMPRRFEQASTALKNNFLAAVGQVDIDPLISSVDALATSLADPKVIDGIQSIATGIGQVVAVGGSGLKTVVSNTDALMAITGAYAVKVGVGLANSLFVSAKARLADVAATNQQIIASKQAELASTAEALAMQSVVVSSTEAALARAIYARSEAVAAAQSEAITVSRLKSGLSIAAQAEALEVAQLKAVASQLAADRQLEVSRQKAQISTIGLTASHTRLAEIRVTEAAISTQLAAAEGRLSAAQIAAAEALTAAQLRLAAARQAELATGAVVGQQTVALNAARTEGAGILAAQTAAQNALNAAESRGAATRGAALAALGGPLGLVTLGLAAAAAGYIYFSSSADSGTQSLIEQNLTLDETVDKFDQLTAAQQRNQASKWAEAQKSALDDAASSARKYANIAQGALTSSGAARVEDMRALSAMIAEVGSGKKTLDDVTVWLQSTQSLAGGFKTSLEEIAAGYDSSLQSAAAYGDRINAVATASNQAAGSTDRLAAAQSKAGDNQKVSAAAWDKYIEQLTKARDLIGANAAAEAEYTARKMGAAPAQIEEAKRIATQTDLLGKYQDAVRDSNKAEQERLKALLVASYTAMQAAEDLAAAKKKADTEAAKSAEDSSKRQITAIEKVAAASYAALLQKPVTQQNLSGYGLLTNGGIAPAAPVAPRKTPQQLADEAAAQITAGTTPNKTKTPKGDSGKSALNAAMTAFDELYKKADPAAQAVRDLTEAQEKLQLALSKGKITQEQYGVAMGQASRDYAAVLASTKAMNEAQNDQVQLLTLTGQLRAANTLKSSIDDAAQLVEYERQGNFEAAKRLETMIKIRDVNLKASLKPGTVEGVSEAPQLGGLDTSAGGAYGEIKRLNDEAAKVDAWRTMELEKQRAYLDLKGVNEATYAERVANIHKQSRESLTKIEGAKNAAIITSSADFFGNMATLSQSGNKKLAAVGKAAAIAQATMQGFVAVQNALAVQPYPLGMALAVSAGVVAAANVASIAGVGFSGGGYTGPGGVHEEAGVVHKGEVVWSQKDIQRFGGVAAVEALRKGDVSAVTSPVSASVVRGSSAAMAAPEIKIYVGGDGSGGSVSATEGYEQMGIAVLATVRSEMPKIARSVIQQEKGQNGLLDPSNRRNQ